MSNLDPVTSMLEASGKYVAVADSRHRKGHERNLRRRLPGLVHLHQRRFHQEKSQHYAGRGSNAIVEKPIAGSPRRHPNKSWPFVPESYMAGNRSVYKAALLKNMVGYSLDGQMSMKAAQKCLQNVLKQFEPSVIAAGSSINLAATFDKRLRAKSGGRKSNNNLLARG